MTELLQCYNKGCGKKYAIDQNTEDICQFHPGEPIFHDALKGWSCCKKRSTDFTEFLNIPGCIKGIHNNKKPEPAETNTTNKENSNAEVVKVPDVQKCPKPIAAPKERPSQDAAMVTLKLTVGSSLRAALEKLKLNTADITKDLCQNNEEVSLGTSCKNNACTKVYQDESSNSENCFYHPGCPIFHEGMKYWSCCRRKTTEFDNFLSQQGCTEGNHLWIKVQKKVDCRYDWHQTAQFVTISVFAKFSQPQVSWVTANAVTIKMCIVYENGKSEFAKDIILKGVIDPEKSEVKMLGSKVEINLRKAEPGSWSSLELPVQATMNTDDSDEDVEFE